MIDLTKMQNSLNFKSGLKIWVTQDEFDVINHSLVAGDRFVSLPRIKQTFNIDTISNLGIDDLFYDEKVRGAEFRFTPSSVVAKLGDMEFVYQGNSWNTTRCQFEKGMTFDELIASQTI